MSKTTKTHFAEVAGIHFPIGIESESVRDTIYLCWLRYNKQTLVNLWSKRGKKYQDIEFLEFTDHIFNHDRGLVDPIMN